MLENRCTLKQGEISFHKTNITFIMTCHTRFITFIKNQSGQVQLSHTEQVNDKIGEGQIHILESIVKISRINV